MITAIAGLALLVAVVVSSVVIVRRRLRYETWYFVHLYAYAAIALAFSHQLATGTASSANPAARTYWTGLYVATLARDRRLPARRAARAQRAPPAARRARRRGGAGRRLGRDRRRRARPAGARTGQFFLWRFLTRDRWWEAHPFSLSAAPDGRRLRITVKGVGDYTARLRAMPAGTRVIAEGPFGRSRPPPGAARACADRRRDRDHADPRAAGGHAGRSGDIAVVYRALRGEDVILRAELDELAGAAASSCTTSSATTARATLLSPEHLSALVPDIAGRDVYVCGPPGMTEATRAALARSGVSRRHVVTERFAY